MFSKGFARWAAIACAAMLTGGCGSGDSVQRFEVSGNITLGGAPVSGGQILFEPDVSKTNQGPAGFAAIKDGRYSTGVGGEGNGRRGAPGAHHRNGGERRQALFADYTIAIDLPKEKSNLDFDVPASTKRPSEAQPAEDPSYQGPRRSGASCV